jgi:predicted  nucleic acid-binding Zn-ribbon protein
VNNDKITSHFEPLPSGDVERKKVDLSASQDKGSSSALRSTANGARAPLNATERQQATLNKNNAMDAFHGRLAGIKQNVDALNSRLTDLEEKVHTDEAKLEKGNPKDFKVD